MIDILLQYGLFLAKSVTVLVLILVILGSLFSLVREAREHAHERLEIKNLNRRFEHMADILNHELLDADTIKRQRKERQKEEKRRQKAIAKGLETAKPRVFVLSFDGDLQAHAADSLREEISAVLQVAGKDDELLLRLESPGGLVHSYGLAASQLARVRDRNLKLTVVVDKVAASGGYLMACVADKILAAPFAVIGSIGVVAQIPNFNRVLKKNEIDVELHTAGQYKRTLTMFGENTDEARAKFREELEDTHALFKKFVAEYRPSLNMEKVATGEHWFGTRAVDLKLVDEITTSDDYLLKRAKEADLYEIHYRERLSLSDRLSQGLVKLGMGLRGGLEKLGARPI